MNALVAAACRASVGPAPGKTNLYYARLAAARCLRSGWTLAQVKSKTFDYGWLLSLDKSPQFPLRELVKREIEIDVARAFDPLVASVNAMTRRLAA